MQNSQEIRNAIGEWRDFLSFGGIKRKTGISEEDLIKAAIKELVDNSLDECGYCKLERTSQGFYVEDDGGGIAGSDEEIAYYFSLKRPRISSKSIHLPTRGFLGEGIKLFTGVFMNIPGTEIIVSTRGRSLKLEPQISGYTKYTRIGNYDKKGTRIEVIFPENIEDYIKNKQLSLSDMLEWGELSIEMAKGRDYKGKSSPWWYDTHLFRELLSTMILPDEFTLKEALAEIFDIDKETLDKLPFENFFKKDNKLLTHEECDDLLVALRKKIKRKKIKPIELGYTGELPHFSCYEIKEGSYIYKDIQSNTEAIIPYVIEVWGRRNNKENSMIQVFVNKTFVKAAISLMKLTTGYIVVKGCGIYDRIHNVPFDEEIELRLNIIAPFLSFTSNGKEPDLREMQDDIISVIKKVIKSLAPPQIRTESFKKSWEDNADPELLNKIKNKISQIPYEEIKRKAKELSMSAKDLIVLAPKNDPYYIGHFKTDKFCMLVCILVGDTMGIK